MMPRKKLLGKDDSALWSPALGSLIEAALGSGGTSHRVAVPWVSQL
jgi:hypothetical protein